MKNFLSLLLAFSLVLSFSSCSFSPKDEPSSEVSSSTEPETSNPPAYKDVFILGPAAEGEPVLLDRSGKFYSCNIEIDGVILSCSRNGEISAFSAETGACLYETSSPGYMIRFETYSEKTGYDYRLVMEDRVVYRSSKDGDKKFTELLPNGLVFDHGHFPCEVKNVYDMNEKSFVWAADEGIMLFDKDNESQKLILSNPDYDEATNLLKDLDVSFVQEYGFTFLYQNPRFILDGTKLVVAIISSEGIYYGFIIYDIASAEIALSHAFPEPDYPVYPINDRYAVSRSSRDYFLIDAATNEISQTFLWRDVMTNYYEIAVVPYYDYENGYDPTDARNLRAYVCQVSDPDDVSRPLVFAADPEKNISLSLINEHYVVLSHEDLHFLIKYSY